MTKNLTMISHNPKRCIQEISMWLFLIVNSSLFIVYFSADKYLCLITGWRCHDELINKQINII